MSTAPSEEDLLFNVVVTPGTFRYLKLFTRSLLARSNVRLRLVANGCPPEDVHSMREFAAAAEGRVESLELSSAEMVVHGAALDELYDARDDGDYFCFVDSDVKARQPFMASFLELLPRCSAVTSCNVAWSDDTVLPPGARDLVGRHAVGSDGYVYGTSYLAIYSRDAVGSVRERWGATFRAGAHEQLPSPIQRRLASVGRQFRLYDTAKVLNILLQADGYALVHVDNPALIHIGGISQYLSDRNASRFAASGSGRERLDFARWAAATLRNLVDGEGLPPLPGERDEQTRAGVVQRELVDLARNYA